MTRAQQQAVADLLVDYIAWLNGHRPSDPRRAAAQRLTRAQAKLLDRCMETADMLHRAAAHWRRSRALPR